MKFNLLGGSFGNRFKSSRWLKIIFIIIGVCLTVSTYFQYQRSVADLLESSFQFARAVANSSFSRDIASRKWVAFHGGVYIPIGEKAVPNPYLNVPNRDVVTTEGLKLTLINPAYMTRLIHEFFHQDVEESHIHITSMKPINPDNRPDEWERKALLILARGGDEFSEVTQFHGKPHVRLMRPLYVEKSCLKCHDAQGYKAGDLRGGLCVSVPYDKYLAAVNKNSRKNFNWFFINWLSVMIVLALMYMLSNMLFQRNKSAQAELAVRLNELHEENVKLEQARVEREKLESRLLQAQKMEAIGTLAGGIAHDFNNILSAIFGYTGLSMIGVSPDSELAKNLEQVLRAGERAKDLVKQILCFSRQNKGKLMPVQLSLNVKEILKMIRASLPVTIEIVQNIDNDPNYVYADPTQIHQVVMNLCTNAFQSMEKTGGKLSVTLKKVIFSEVDLGKHPDVKMGEYMQLSVCDTGGGIDPTIKERIFEPYFTTKGIGEGTGMGLAIVHGIVTNCGGFVSVYSDPGKGTSFNVFIPVWKGDEPESIEIKETAVSGNERILFVDDEPSIVEVSTRILEELGYTVTGTISSFSALNIFEKNPNSFDLVITDQTMPKLTGYHLAEKLIKIRPDIPIIVCTGFSSTVDKEMAESLGIKKFVLKPMTTLDISKVIRKVLDSEKK